MRARTEGMGGTHMSGSQRHARVPAPGRQLRSTLVKSRVGLVVPNLRLAQLAQADAAKATLGVVHDLGDVGTADELCNTGGGGAFASAVAQVVCG